MKTLAAMHLDLGEKYIGNNEDGAYEAKTTSLPEGDIDLIPHTPHPNRGYQSVEYPKSMGLNLRDSYIDPTG